LCYEHFKENNSKGIEILELSDVFKLKEVEVDRKEVKKTEGEKV